MSRPVIGRDKLGALTKIGQGGQGVVYGAPNVKTKFAASMVYKEYKTQTLAEIDFTALAAMPALVEDSLSYAEAEQLIAMAAWPCALIEDAGASTGFVMPAIPEEFFIELTTVKGVSRTTAEFQHLLNHPSVLAARGIIINDAQRYGLLREAASGLAFLHKHGVCVGDISPKNLLFGLSPHEAIYFIDCDAMRINGTSVQAQVETPGWQAPAGEELATIYTDTYKLGLLALRLLAGDHDASNPDHLPATTPTMLRQIITDTLTKQPLQRPLPESWAYVLGNAVEEAQYRQKAAATTPPTTAAEDPPIPVVHSRPSSNPTPPSTPPTQAAYAAPPPPAPPSAYSQPPMNVPAPSASGSSRTLAWVGVGVAAAAVLAVIALIVVMVSKNNGSSSNTAATTSQSSAYSSESSEPSTAPAAAQPSTPTTPTVSVPPPNLVQGLDSHGTDCSAGYHLTNRSGWATNSGRGSADTSCIFVDNVLQSYWNRYPSPSRDSRQLVVPGSLPCPSVAANFGGSVACSGDDFIMTCGSNGDEPWITCTGGHEAIIYIY